MYCQKYSDRLRTTDSVLFSQSVFWKSLVSVTAFAVLTGTAVSLAVAAIGASAFGGEDSRRDETRAACRDTAQFSEDGVVIHPFESSVMRGNPPAKNDIVTLDTYEYIHAHRVWAVQHMRELCPTQLISRGRGPVAVLPRQPLDIDGVQIKDLGGNPITVRQLLEKTCTDAFLVLHKGHIRTEQYFSGMTPDAPHRVYSAGKSLLADVVGVLVDEGKLREQACIVEYIPELARTAYAGATVRQLLDMESGVRYEYDLTSVHNSMTRAGQAFSSVRVVQKTARGRP